LNNLVTDKCWLERGWYEIPLGQRCARGVLNARPPGSDKAGLKVTGAHECNQLRTVRVNAVAVLPNVMHHGFKVGGIEQRTAAC
jgi:hypothetical protein